MIADHLSRVEKPTVQEKGREIAENFPDEQLFQLSLQSPWYADIVNYLACGIMPSEFSYQQRKRLRTDSRYYIWDDPLLFKRGADLIIRRCVPEGEQSKILKECHSSPYGGHFAGDKTAHKILQSGFYWPTVTPQKYPRIFIIKLIIYSGYNWANLGIIFFLFLEFLDEY